MIIKLRLADGQHRPLRSLKFVYKRIIAPLLILRVEVYFRCLRSVSEPLAAKQSNDPATTIDNNIIPTILTTFYQKNLV